MGKAKLLGRVINPPQRDNKERLRWQAQQARKGRDSMPLADSRPDLIAPCRGCLKRVPGCHDHCPDYQDWSRGNEERRAKRQFEADCRQYDKAARRRKFDKDAKRRKFD